MSGGLSSSIAGGNFWAGVRQGLITSGLNHLAHEVASGINKMKFKKMIRERLEDAGYSDPDASASYENLNLIEFAKQVLPELFASAHSPGIEKREHVFESSSGDEVDGLAPFEIGKMRNGKLAVRFAGPIQIAKSAYITFLHLASTIGHELLHVTNMYNKNSTLWLQKGREYMRAKTEYESYNWESINGGTHNGIQLIENTLILRKY